MSMWLLTAALLVDCSGGAYNTCETLFSLPGDFIIGGLFPVHSNTTWTSGVSEPEMPLCKDLVSKFHGTFGWLLEISCYYSGSPGDRDQFTQRKRLLCKVDSMAGMSNRLNAWGYSQFQAMRLAVEEINNSSRMLPNITLGYHVWDTCGESIYLQAALQLAPGRLHSLQSGSSNQMVAVVGPDEADTTLLTSQIFTFYRLPQISYSAKDQRFIDTNLFPFLFRMVPNENHQIYGILSLIQAFDWKWVSAVGHGTKSSQKAIQTLVAEASARNICIIYHGVMMGDDDIAKIQLQRIVSNTVKVKTNITIIYGERDIVYKFFKVVVELNVTGKVWIAIESWVLLDFIASIPGIRKTGTVVGLTIKPIKLPQFTSFVERTRHCSILSDKTSLVFSEPEKLAETESCGQSCEECHSLPQESLDIVLNSSIWHWSFYSYAAIYAVAEALHVCLGCDGLGSCQRDKDFEPWQLYELLYHVNFPLLNNTIKFSSQGDLSLGYDVLTWIWENDTCYAKTIGSFSSDNLNIASNEIRWETSDGQVPQSVCITECDEGQIQSKQSLDECSCRCEDCLEGTYPNQTYLDACIPCPSGTWSPKKSPRCFPPTLTFLDIKDTKIFVLLILTFIDFFLLCGCLLVFATHWKTPVVKAAGGNLAFVMLGSLLACCASTGLFVERPTSLSCLIRQPIFAMSFTLCVSCMVVRSFQIVFIFKMAYKLPMVHKCWIKYRGTYFFVAISCGVQGLACFLWLFFSPPSLQGDVVSKKEIFLRCSEGHYLGLGGVLAYVTLLCGAGFVFAFWGRKLPKNYSEARLQTVSMLVFLMAWGCFMLIYATTEGKGKQIAALQMFTVQTSVYAVLCTFFLPKCYIILFKPQANTIAHFQTCIQAYTTTARDCAK